MLVDDSSIDLMINKRHVEKCDIASAIHVFSNPRQALKTLIAKEITPDVLLLDIRMNEMDGFDFLENLEQQTEKAENTLHIYLVSSTLDSRDISRAKASVLVSDIIPKPLNKEKLLTFLKRDKVV